jgi:hypothetical protein
MTERQGDTGNTKDNVRDEFGEAKEHGRSDKDASKDAVEQVQDTVGGVTEGLPVVGGGGGGGAPLDQVHDTVGGLTGGLAGGGGGDDEEEGSGGGGVKDNVKDDWDESQRR